MICRDAEARAERGYVRESATKDNPEKKTTGVYKEGARDRESRH